MSERQTYIPVEALGLTEEMSQQIETTKSYRGKRDWEHFTPDFVNTHSQSEDLGDLLRQAIQVRGNYEKGRLEQNEGIINFPQTLPISIAFMGDLHFGSLFCETDEVVRKFNEIKDTPNMYVVFMSNLIENAIPSQFPSNMLNATLTPDKQVFRYEKDD